MGSCPAALAGTAVVDLRSRHFRNRIPAATREASCRNADAHGRARHSAGRIGGTKHRRRSSAAAVDGEVQQCSDVVRRCVLGTDGCALPRRTAADVRFRLPHLPNSGSAGHTVARTFAVNGSPCRRAIWPVHHRLVAAREEFRTDGGTHGQLAFEREISGTRERRRLALLAHASAYGDSVVTVLGGKYRPS